VQQTGSGGRRDRNGGGGRTSNACGADLTLNKTFLRFGTRSDGLGLFEWIRWLLRSRSVLSTTHSHLFLVFLLFSRGVTCAVVPSVQQKEKKNMPR
jgi:hypothetical protein